MSFFSPVVPSSTLALASTVHLALAALRYHRRPPGGVFNALAVVSVALAMTPWTFPAAAGILAGFAVHGLWFTVCEHLAPAGTPVPATRASAVGIPVSSVFRPAPPSHRPATFVQAPVLAVFAETPDIRTFRIARPSGFDFSAGQFLPVRVLCDGREHVRCYSISSAPASTGYVEISVKRQGLVSSTLHAIITPGSQLTVRAPAGTFTYPASDDRPILLLAGGIGITPLLSMLRHGVSADPSRPITLIYSAPTVEALAFRDDVRELCRRHPQVRALFAVTRGGGGPDVYAGRIDQALLRASMSSLRDAVAMICGPQSMIETMRALLSAEGLTAPQIRSELFEAAVAASAGHHPDAAPNPSTALAHDVKCTRSGRTVRSAAGQTLLDAAEAGGIAIDSLCRAGLCGTCRTRVVGGEVACDSTVLADDERARGYVLACVSHAQSDCAIEA